MAVTDAHLSLEEAKDMYQHQMVPTDYKGTKIAHCTGIILGEGTFGKVYKGWRNNGRQHIAVKIIGETYFDRDVYAQEKLDREVDIMRKVRGCDYVVQIFEAMKRQDDVMITMELCDGDLHNLLKVKQSFVENDVIDFLHQLGEGMKELRKHNIVHRDIKPQNILIKYNDKKIVYKLADFGYARHFNAGMLMNTVAGSPLYMAPEALEIYLFPREGLYYNDKVDVWSIGALLYKVLVGKDAFLAQTAPQVYEFLKKKKDNIAFEIVRVSKTQNELVYISELPQKVQNELSPAFCKAITELLVGMLKFDSRKRLSFPAFFEKIEDIIETKVSMLELINLVHGTAVKLMVDPSFKAHTLVAKASSTWNVPQDQVVIFSTVYPKYISARHQIKDEEFTQLLATSGGQDGCAVLYVFTLQCLKGSGTSEPDMSCFKPLKSAIDHNSADHLVKNQKFSEEIMYMIECMERQLYNQLESVGKLYQFTINETSMSDSYNELKKEVYQALGRVSIASEMLKRDVEFFRGGNRDTALQELVEELHKKKEQLNGLEEKFAKTIPLPKGPFHWKEYRKKIIMLKDMAEKVQTGDIHTNCSKILQECQDIITDTTKKTKSKLTAYDSILDSSWSLDAKSAVFEEISELLIRIQSARQTLLEGQVNEQFNGQLRELCRAGNQILQSSGEPRSPSNGQNRIDEELLIEAKDVVTRLCGGTSTDRKEHTQLPEFQSDSVVKITYPENYRAGDIVLLTPVNTLKGSVPSILHLNWKNPHMLMDFTCLIPMRIKPGNVPQLFLGKLRETPQKFNLEDYPATAQSIGQSEGVYYRARIDPVSIKFLGKDVTLLRQEEQQKSVSIPRGRRSQTQK